MRKWPKTTEQLQTYTLADYTALLRAAIQPDEKALYEMTRIRHSAREAADRTFGRSIYIRGLIEISSFCKNNCYYCGIRRGNGNAARYRLSYEEILSCCCHGYELGFRTFVLQGGEDAGFQEQEMLRIISGIKHAHPDCAVTLSLGEKSPEIYRQYFNAGADRYLLRHETADQAHYETLHPKEMSYRRRIDCLYALKDIGFQVGTGFMVGSPQQTPETLAKDLHFIASFRPHMVGIGPFIPHKDTPYASYPPGSADLTLFLISVLRLMLPKALIPATTALGTLRKDGRTQGILAGANVIMPNLSPPEARQKYMLYDHKCSTGAESAEGLAQLKTQLQAIGYEITAHRGDHPDCCGEHGITI